jgi:hypothetical protein
VGVPRDLPPVAQMDGWTQACQGIRSLRELYWGLPPPAPQMISGSSSIVRSILCDVAQ